MGSLFCKLRVRSPHASSDSSDLVVIRAAGSKQVVQLRELLVFLLRYFSDALLHLCVSFLFLSTHRAHRTVVSAWRRSMMSRM